MPSPGLLNESARLKALDSYKILDTPPEEVFDRIARIASAALQCPIALISFVDRDRQWFKSRVGLDVRETARDISFCTHALVHEDIFTVEDATIDSTFCQNPLVIGEPNIKFYAGAPLVTRDGYKLGTLCVFDKIVHELLSSQKDVLTDLAALVMEHLELRRLKSGMA